MPFKVVIAGRTVSSLNWKGSGPGEGDPKAESGSYLRNGMSIPTDGALGETIDAYDELTALSWKSSWDAFRRHNQADSLDVYELTYS